MGKDWQEFEVLVEKIYKELEPKSTIIRDDKIMGYNSKKKRQIDVSIKTNVAGTDILIIIQAKDRSRKAGIEMIDKFATVIEDVRASKGILVHSKGFTKTAIEYASNIGVELCTAHDAKSKNWTLELKLPVLAQVYEIQKAENTFKIAKQKYPIDFKLLESSPTKQEFYNSKNENLENPVTVFTKKWNLGKLNATPNRMHEVLLFKMEDNVYIKDSEDRMLRIEYYYINYEVVLRSWLKYCTPSEFRGLKNHQNNQLIVSHVMVNKEELKPSEKNGWQVVEDIEKLPMETEKIIYYSGQKVFEVNEEESKGHFIPIVKRKDI